MKTSYFRRRSGLLSGGARLSLLFAGILLALGLAFRFLLPGAFFAATAPLFAFGNAVSAYAGSLLAGFGSAGEREARIRELEAENESLADRNRALLAELHDLAPLEGATNASDITAGVMARPPLAPYDMLIVGVGADGGVRQGALVLTPGGVPLGTVATVARGTAQVSLFSSAGRATEGWAGTARLPITLVGKGAGAFVADIPRDAARSPAGDDPAKSSGSAGIGVGDEIYVPGPGALPIGTVARIELDPSSPRASVRIAPLANPFSIAWVVIRAAP